MTANRKRKTGDLSYPVGRKGTQPPRLIKRVLPWFEMSLAPPLIGHTPLDPCDRVSGHPFLLSFTAWPDRHGFLAT